MCERRTSPVDKCVAPMCSASACPCVPFPEPAAPRRMMRISRPCSCIAQWAVDGDGPQRRGRDDGELTVLQEVRDDEVGAPPLLLERAVEFEGGADEGLEGV